MRRRIAPKTAPAPGPDLGAAAWDDVRVILAVLRHGSFTAAARALGTEQSTVSRRIAALEAALGVALFERGRRAPTPTEAALELRPAAERIEAEIGQLIDAATGPGTRAIRGRVRIATTDELAAHVLVPRALPGLRAAHPELTLEVLTSYAAADLIGHQADVAVRFFPTTRGELIGRRIARLPTAILCARGRAAAWRRRPVTALDWIAVELAGLATPESTWLAAHVARPPSLVCSSYQVQLAAIRAGLGIGIGPRAYARFDRGLAVLDGADLPALDVYLVTRRAIRHLPRIAVVLDAIAAAVGELTG